MMINCARKRGGKKGGDGAGRGEGRIKIPTVNGGLSQPLFPSPHLEASSTNPFTLSPPSPPRYALDPLLLNVGINFLTAALLLQPRRGWQAVFIPKFSGRGQ